MNLQYHLDKYSDNKKLQEHLNAMLDFFLDNFDNYLHFSEGSISFKQESSDTWAWIDTFEGRDNYDLLLKNRYLYEHEIEDLLLEDTQGIDIKTGNKRCPRFTITENFKINQPSFKSFLEKRYQKYKRHKEEGKPDAMERKNKSEIEKNYWIFQANPDVFDVFAQLKDNKDAWHVNSHKKSIKPGDKALLYITGSNAGFYGTAEINSDVYDLDGQNFCNIKLEYLFLDEPILKDEIINNPILRESKAGSQGSNFSSSKEEYDELIKMHLEKKMPESKYKNFNGYDIELLKIAFEEYINFSEENPEKESYKYEIMERLNNKLDSKNIRIENIQEIVETLKENNPTSGSFVHWSNIDNLIKYTNQNPGEVVELMSNLLNDNQTISNRIDDFLVKAREFQSDIRLGTPLFAYLLCAFDNDKYIIYKDKTFQKFCKWFDLNVPSNIGEKYEYYISVCNELLYFARENIDKEFSLLNMQDFIYVITRYPESRFRTSLRYVHKILEQNTLIISSIEKSRINNLLQEINELLTTEEKLMEVDLEEKIYIRDSNQAENKYKFLLSLYPMDKPSDKDASPYCLGINENNQIAYGLCPAESYNINAEVETASVEEISYNQVLEKFLELLGKFQELNSEEFEIETKKQDANQELNKRVLPSVSFDRQIKLDGLYFPDEERLLNQISIALKNGKNIILIGPPGTGKSKLAKEISSQYIGEGNYKMTTATSDWSTFETIGGYQPDRENTLSFKRGLFLQCFKTDPEGYPDNKWLIVDEINRADIDKAFGSLFSALTGDSITLNYKSQGNRNIEVKPQQDEEIADNDYEYVIPKSWRMIGTMNTFDKTSLYEMSYAFMRRFAFIPVNVPLHIDSNLIKKYLECWQINDKRFVDETVKLWKKINEYRKIGPALVEDIYKYLIESDGDYSSAVTMYLFPQLEGMMEDSLYKLLQELYQFDETGLMKNFAVDYFGLERIPDETGN